MEKMTKEIKAQTNSKIAIEKKKILYSFGWMDSVVVCIVQKILQLRLKNSTFLYSND